MKKLHLIRHAKSSWEDQSLPDIQRPINQRGITSCQTMAMLISELGCDFSNTFCSSALRAQQTITEIASHLPAQQIQWNTQPSLYTFNPSSLMAWCRRLDDKLSEVVIIGHNPAITIFCNQFSDNPIDNVPTCGYIQLELADEKWADLSSHNLKLKHFLYPKMKT